MGYSLRGQGLIFGRLRLEGQPPIKSCALRNSEQRGRLGGMIVVARLPRDCGVSLAHDLRTPGKRRVASRRLACPSRAVGLFRLGTKTHQHLPVAQACYSRRGGLPESARRRLPCWVESGPFRSRAGDCLAPVVWVGRICSSPSMSPSAAPASSPNDKTTPGQQTNTSRRRPARFAQSTLRLCSHKSCSNTPSCCTLSGETKRPRPC
jgi:hypothetical protein